SPCRRLAGRWPALLRPLQIAQLASRGDNHQDHSRVPMAVAAGPPGGHHQALDPQVRTEEFTVIGAGRPVLRFSTIFRPRSNKTGELVFSCLVPTGALGTHGHPWPEVSRPYGLSEAAQDPEPPARESPRRPSHGIDASLSSMAGAFFHSWQRRTNV